MPQSLLCEDRSLLHLYVSLIQRPPDSCSKSAARRKIGQGLRPSRWAGRPASCERAFAFGPNRSGFKGFEATAWYALAAPAGTPSEIIGKLNAATNAFLKSPKGQDALAKLSIQAVGGSPADLKAFIATELKKWGPVVKEANISM